MTKLAPELEAVATLHHAYFTGLVLTQVTRRSAEDAARWTHAVFRHQHEEKFLSSFEKLGLADLPHAVACATYHYLSNAIGGMPVEFMKESEKKAWVRFPPPRWLWQGPALCGIPGIVSRAILTGWYAQNGVTLGNPRLGFVCTAQTMEGGHGLAGYFLEYDRDLAPEERLLFRPGEMPPPFDPEQAPKPPADQWPAERLAKAKRNYAMEYVRSGLPRLAELFGPADAAYLGRVAGQLIGAQYYREIAEALGIAGQGPRDFADWMAGLAAGEGDDLSVEVASEAVLVNRPHWRLMRGIEGLPTAVFEAWNGLFEGALMAHNRFLVLEVLARRDYGDDAFVWRIRERRMT